jgi:hypothetical protein
VFFVRWWWSQQQQQQLLPVTTRVFSYCIMWCS